MSNIVPLNAGRPPAAFVNRADLPDMNKSAQAGVNAGFAVIGFKGRNWRIKAHGEEILMKDERGPLPSIDVVIVGISSAVSKQWYEKKFSEGDDASPDCFSTNGIAPDPTSPNLQCGTCAACPQNVWGSRINDNGKKAKACQDTRRMAVVPTGDIENNTYGGPMLLRIPPTTLANLDRYSRELQRFSAQPYMVSTRLGFDFDVAYPLITFTAAGWLGDGQAAQVEEMLPNPLISRILEVGDEVLAEVPAPSALAAGKPSAGFSQPKLEAPTKPKPAPVVAEVVPEEIPEEDDEEVAAMAALAAAKAKKAAKAEAAAAAAKPKSTGQRALTPEEMAEAADIDAEMAARKAAREAKAAAAAKPPAKPPANAFAAAATAERTEQAEEKPAPRSQIQAAPDDLTAAIDDLLAS